MLRASEEGECISHAINLDPDPQKAHAAAVADIAKETATSVDIVKALYEEDVAALNAQAAVKQFITVIAVKRVKQQLRELAMEQ